MIGRTRKIWERWPRYRHKGITSIAEADRKADDSITGIGIGITDANGGVNNLGIGTKGATSNTNKRRQW